jgi:hypothetical protein
MSLPELATDILCALRDSCINQKDVISSGTAQSFDEYKHLTGRNIGLHIALTAACEIAEKYLGKEFVSGLGINRPDEVTANVAALDGELLPPPSN